MELKHTISGKGFFDDSPFKWILLLPALPASALVSLFCLVLLARIRLGYWPTPMNPDPWFIKMSYQLWYLLTFVLLIVYIVCSVIHLHNTREHALKVKTALLWFVIGVVSWILLIFVLKNDPGQYIKWLYD